MNYPKVYKLIQDTDVWDKASSSIVYECEKLSQSTCDGER